MEKGVLYIVSTPIGNLKDITLRAIEILKSVDFIASEDTRTSQILLNKLNITSFSSNTKLISYHKFNEKSRVSYFLDLLNNGKNIALISDAGTPCICDPGRILINHLLQEGIKIIPIPGPCAFVTFLSAVQKEDENFIFLGFLPRQDNKQTDLFKQYCSIDLLFYESPNRVLNTLENIAKSRSNNTLVSIGRELTKIHEEILTLNVIDMIKYFNDKKIKGEFIILVHKDNTDSSDNQKDDILIKDHILKLKAQNFSNKDISIILSSLYNLNKNKIYKISLTLN